MVWYRSADTGQTRGFILRSRYESDVKTGAVRVGVGPRDYLYQHREAIVEADPDVGILASQKAQGAIAVTRPLTLNIKIDLGVGNTVCFIRLELCSVHRCFL